MKISRNLSTFLVLALIATPFTLLKSASAETQVGVPIIRTEATRQPTLISQQGQAGKDDKDDKDYKDYKEGKDDEEERNKRVGAVSGYQIVTQDFSFSGGTTGTAFGPATAMCPAGKKAVGGGYELNPEVFRGFAAIVSKPDKEGQAWSVFVQSISGSVPGVLTFTAYAVCVNATQSPSNVPPA